MIPREIQVNTLFPFSVSIYDRAIQIVPSSAKISIYNNAGTAIISAQSMTVSAGGTMSYNWLAASNTTEGKNFKAEIAYVVNSVTTTLNYLFDVVKTPLVNTVTDSDLFQYVGELRDKVREKTTETTALGTTSTAVIGNLISDSRDFTGGSVTFFIPGVSCVTEHQAKITVYDSATGTVTFSPVYTAAIASGTTVKIRPSYQSTIDLAFNQFVLRDIRNKMNAGLYGSNQTASGYVSGEVVKNLVCFKTLEIICFSNVESSGDKWELRTNYFRQMYQDNLISLSEPFDQDGDGNMSDLENAQRPTFGNVDFIR